MGIGNGSKLLNQRYESNLNFQYHDGGIRAYYLIAKFTGK